MRSQSRGFPCQNIICDNQLKINICGNLWMKNLWIKEICDNRLKIIICVNLWKNYVQKRITRLEIGIPRPSA